MDLKKMIPKNLADIFAKINKDKIYGSVEIYFESGEITQFTQRIINKVARQRSHSKKGNLTQKNILKKPSEMIRVPDETNPGSTTRIY